MKKVTSFFLPSSHRLIINKFCILSPVVFFSSFCAIQNVCLRMEAKKKELKTRRRRRRDTIAMKECFVHIIICSDNRHECVYRQHHHVCTNGRLGWRERQIKAQSCNIMGKCKFFSPKNHSKADEI